MDCKANSSADFQALPGYLFRDTIDVEYYVINAPDLPPSGFAYAGARVKAPSDIYVPGNNYPSGGIAGIGASKMDPYFLLTYFTIAPYVYDNGKLIDDGFSMYRSLQGRLHHQTPVSLTHRPQPGRLGRNGGPMRTSSFTTRKTCPNWWPGSDRKALESQPGLYHQWPFHHALGRYQSHRFALWPGQTAGAFCAGGAQRCRYLRCYHSRSPQREYRAAFQTGHQGLCLHHR